MHKAVLKSEQAPEIRGYINSNKQYLAFFTEFSTPSAQTKQRPPILHTLHPFSQPTARAYPSLDQDTHRTSPVCKCGRGKLKVSTLGDTPECEGKLAISTVPLPYGKMGRYNKDDATRLTL